MRSVIYGALAALAVLAVGGLAIIGVAKVRDAAQRMGCSNNLKLIGISMHGYQDAMGVFPAAAMPNAELPPEKRISWLAAIYPYVESSPIYGKMNIKESWDAEQNRFAALTPIRWYQCPAYPADPSLSTLIPSDYLGMGGIGSDAAGLPIGDPRAGFFGYDRKLTLSDIEGYKSMLVAVAETGQARGAWTAGGPATVRGLEPDGPANLAVGGPFGGYHWEGVNVVMADGSVKLLNRDVSAEVLESMVVLRHTATPPSEN